MALTHFSCPQCHIWVQMAVGVHGHRYLVVLGAGSRELRWGDWMGVGWNEVRVNTATAFHDFFSQLFLFLFLDTPGTILFGVWGSNLRFEFALYLNLNLLRGSGSGILLNLIPEPQVQNWVWTRFRRFRNQTVASLTIKIWGKETTGFNSFWSGWNASSFHWQIQVYHNLLRWSFFIWSNLLSQKEEQRIHSI